MLPPPESPGQEKSTPHDPDIVRHYRLRIHAHVLSERKKHRLRIRCHASLRKEKTATHSFMLSSLEYPGQEKSMPHDPDTVPQHPPRIHGHVLSERTPTCYTLFVHAFFSGENGSEEKQRGITIKISEPEQEKPFVCALPEKSQPRIRNHAFPPKEKPATYSFMLSLRNLRDRKNPYRTNPIQSRSTLHEFTVIFSPKGKPPATHYSFLLSSLECMVEPRKTLRKRRDILFRTCFPSCENSTVDTPDPHSVRCILLSVSPDCLEPMPESRAQNCWKTFFEKKKK